MRTQSIPRRLFHRHALTAVATACALPSRARAASAGDFRFRHVIASSLFGKLPLAEILPAIAECGSDSIDLWPPPHGDQRVQVDQMGIDAYLRLAAGHGVKTRILTRYDLGPFGLEPELAAARRLGATTIVTGARGPKALTGAELKGAVATFAEQLKPHADAAAGAGVTIAIENHGASLIDSPDSIRWLVEAIAHPNIGIALAPYHLPQEPGPIADLIRALDGRIAVFYAWQHGDGSAKGLTKEQELLQFPGRGPLDFRPIIAALREIRYDGPTEIFMHPFPRGIPFLPTIPEIVREMNRARSHLDALL